MADSDVRRLLSITGCFFLSICVHAESPSQPPLPTVQIVVWIRAASEVEMRLEPTWTPALRHLVRRSAVFAKLAPLSRPQLIDALQAVGNSLDAKVQEISLHDPSVPDSVAQLIAILGAPPPPSAEEKAALDRLEAARKAASAPPTEMSPPAVRPNPSSPDGKPLAESTRNLDPDNVVVKAIEDEIPLILLLDPYPAGSQREALARDALLARIADAVAADRKGDKGVPRHRYLITVLIPATGDAALVATGTGLRAGVCFRQRLATEEIAAGVRALLTPRDAEPTRSHADWLLRARVPSSPTEEGGAP